MLLLAFIPLYSPVRWLSIGEIQIVRFALQERTVTSQVARTVQGAGKTRTHLGIAASAQVAEIAVTLKGREKMTPLLRVREKHIIAE